MADNANIITPPGNPPEQTPLTQLNLQPVNQQNQQVQQPVQQPATPVVTPPAGQNQDAINQLLAILNKPADTQNVQLPTTGFNPTGDDVLDGMVESVSLAYPGLNIERAVGRAISEGDARFIDEAYIREIAGAKGDQVLRVAKAAVQHITNAAAAVQRDVMAAAGGADKWGAAVAVFNKTAAPELRQAIATMADNPKTAVAAAQVILQFAAAGGFINTGSQGQGNQYSAPGNASGLSSKEFKTEMAKLNQTAGQSADYQDKRAELYNRRVLGKNAGLN